MFFQRFPLQAKWGLVLLLLFFPYFRYRIDLVNLCLCDFVLSLWARRFSDLFYFQCPLLLKLTIDLLSNVFDVLIKSTVHVNILLNTRSRMGCWCEKRWISLLLYIASSYIVFCPLNLLMFLFFNYSLLVPIISHFSICPNSQKKTDIAPVPFIPRNTVIRHICLPWTC